MIAYKCVFEKAFKELKNKQHNHCDDSIYSAGSIKANLKEQFSGRSVLAFRKHGISEANWCLCVCMRVHSWLKDSIATVSVINNKQLHLTLSLKVVKSHRLNKFHPKMEA